MGQLLVNTIISTSEVGLMALSVAPIVWAWRVVHLGHGCSVLVGAYVALVCSTWGAPPSFQVVLGMAASAVAGWGMLRLVLEPIRARGARPEVLLLASLGLYIIGENTVALLFGSAGARLSVRAVSLGYALLGGRVTATQLTIMLLCLGTCSVMSVFLRTTAAGLAVRCVAENEGLARIRGVPVGQVRSWSVISSSVLGGIAGVALGFESDVRPTMALGPLIWGLVAAISVTKPSPWALLAVSGILALSRQVTATVIGYEWETVIVFALLALLLARPMRGSKRTASLQQSAPSALP